MQIEEEENFFDDKWNSAKKQVGWKRFMMINDSWIQNCGLPKNEIAYAQLFTTIVLHQLNVG
jgi:hypothetical protein